MKHSAGTDLKAKWGPVVDCIADLLGPKAEVVLHDVSCPERSIIMIRNGQVTGRSLGAPLTDLGFFMLRESEHRIETLGTYHSRTDAGRLLRCNAANLRNSRGAVEAILCINLDVTDDNHEQNGNGGLSEHYLSSINRVVNSMIEDATRQSGRAADLSNESKQQLVRDLDARGVFLARGAVRKVAESLGIAVPTVYKYIHQARRLIATAAKGGGGQ